ncbi:MAG: Adaptive-response sensory-kinase SasA [Syntrophus sp. SKADARSKE-3]|nr:Adaptive-response sensory-kinase SasA [Syntrophus sp. SKADARSKE-3]
MVAESLRILILEDNPADAELVQFEMQEAGLIFTSKVVMTEEDFVNGIQEFSPDLILSDYDLPKYDGALALAEARKRCPDTPFILVTGAVTEDRAIDILTQGAKDYVLKKRLQQRLVPAIKRALAEAEEHRARKQAEEELREAHRDMEAKVKIRTAELEGEIAAHKKTEEALRESEEQFRTMANSIPQLAWIARADGFIFWYNKRWYDYTGTTPEQMEGWGWQSVHDPKVLPEVMERWKTAIAMGEPFDMEFPLLGADNVFRPFLTRVLPLKDGQGCVTQWFGTNTDLSERKRAEEELALNEREFRLLAESMPQIVWTTRVDGWNTYFNQKWVDYTGLTLEESYDGHGWNKPFHPDDQQRAWDAWQNAVLYNAPYLLQCRLRRFDGIYRWWLIHGVPVSDENGKIIKWYGTCTDINDLKLAEEALRDRERLFQDVIDGSTSPIFLKDFDGKFITINASLERMLGMSREEIKGKTDYDIAPKEVADYWRTHDKKVMETGKAIQVEELADLPGGHHIFLANKFPLVDVEGQVYGVGAISHDITKRKRAEEALKQSEQRWATTLASIGDAVIATDAEGKVTFMNAVAETLTGWTTEDATGKSVVEVFNIINEYTRQVVESPVTRVLKEGVIVGLANHTILIRKDGTDIPIDDSGAPIRDADGKTLGVVLVFRDITERKQAEEALIQSEERYRRLFETMQEGFFVAEAVLDESGKPSDLRYLVVNQIMERLTGRTREQLVNHTYRELWANADQKWIAKLANVAMTGEPIFVDGYGPGTGLWLQIQAYSPSHGQVAAIINDITDRKQAEDALRLSEEKFSAAFANNPTAIALTRFDDGLFLEVNNTWVALNGYSRDEVIGHSVRGMGIWPTDDAAKRFRRELEEKGFFYGWEQEFRRKSGEVFIAQLSAQLLTFQGEKIVLSTLVDITKRKQAEMELMKRTQQLEEANKELESFSYSVSHDLKAPLRAIDGYSRMLLKKDADKLSEDTIRKLDVIRSNAEKMNSLIDDLLSFSRVVKSSIFISDINMDKLARDVWSEIRAANADRELEFQIANIVPGKGDSTLIRQVLTNLFSNAVKFTKTRKPGIIEVGCYRENFDVVYFIKDNGVGFDMAYYDKLFGVFQRLHSQEQYEGTGVGLAIVHRIITRHGGRIWAEGKVDKGASFFFTLPHEKQLR